MKEESERLWLQFENSFKNNILYFDKHKSLKDLINNRTELTKFYKTELFIKIAENLNLILSEKEYLRVDMTMYKSGHNKYHVPFVFIESENDPDGDISNEIKKLLHLNAPLKVLITRGCFEQDIRKKDTHWKYVIEDFVEHKRMVGYFIFISAVHNDENPRFQYVAYNEAGSECCDIQEIKIGSTQ